MSPESIYRRNGYASRLDYLKSLASDYGVSLKVVMQFSDALGMEEDFDALVTAVEDYSDMQAVEHEPTTEELTQMVREERNDTIKGLRQVGFDDFQIAHVLVAHGLLVPEG